MSETARTRFLIRGTKEKSEGDVFMDIICIKSPQDRATGRLSLLLTDAYRVYASTIREQLGDRYAETVW